MPTPGQGTIGSLEYTPEERKKLAKKSTTFACEECCSSGTTIVNLLKSREEELAEDNSKGKAARAEEAKQLAMQVSFKVRSRLYPFVQNPTVRITEDSPFRILGIIHHDIKIKIFRLRVKVKMGKYLMMKYKSSRKQRKKKVKECAKRHQNECKRSLGRVYMPEPRG